MNNEPDNPWLASIQDRIGALKYAVQYWREAYHDERRKRIAAEEQLRDCDLCGTINHKFSLSCRNASCSDHLLTLANSKEDC